MLLAGALAAASLHAAPAHLGSHEVSIRNNFYQPVELAIDPGETITWTAIDGGHTATADDGSFDLPAAGTLAAGQSATWTAPSTDVTVPYGCRVHSSMRGAIIVGKGSPVPPPPIEPIEIRTVPSMDYPSIASAMVALPARARVEIAPGTYPESVIVQARAVPGVEPDISLVGVGDEPGDVRITGDGVRNTGVGVLADGVRIDNLTVTGFTSTGVFLDAVRGFVVERVSAIDNGSYGIRARGARAGRIAASEARGSSVAGIAIQDCNPCDVLVQGVHAHTSLAGLSGSGAGGLVVKDSLFTGNSVGIALKSLPGGAPQRGSHILNNVIEPGDGSLASGEMGALDIDAGAGVWIAGGWFNVIQGNVIGGERWGVLVTGFHLPVYGNKIVDNVLSAGTEAHLAWDGLGADTCFVGNRTNDGAAPATQPPVLHELYPCDRPTVGVPYPVVDVALLAAAVG